MRKLLLAAAGAMAFLGAAAANAGPVVSGPVGPLPSALSAPGTFIIGSNLGDKPGMPGAGPGTFDDTFTFTLLGDSAMFNGQVSSIEGPDSVTQNVDFTTLMVDGVSVFTETSTDPKPETWAILSSILLTGGGATHTIEVGGNLNSANGSYVGNFNLQAAVPEPATWAMMLLGFGAMGISMRSRRKLVLAQIA